MQGKALRADFTGQPFAVDILGCLYYMTQLMFDDVQKAAKKSLPFSDRHANKNSFLRVERSGEVSRSTWRGSRAAKGSRL